MLETEIMAQTVECESCGSKEFTNMNREYYSMRWTFRCAECGSRIEIKEEEE